MNRFNRYVENTIFREVLNMQIRTHGGGNYI